MDFVRKSTDRMSKSHHTYITISKVDIHVRQGRALRKRVVANALIVLSVIVAPAIHQTAPASVVDKGRLCVVNQ